MAVDLGLSIPLKRQESMVSNSGTNTICLPSDLASSLDSADDLEDAINALVSGMNPDAVVKIMKLYRACDEPEEPPAPIPCDNFEEYAPFVYVNPNEGDDDDSTSHPP